VQALSSAGDFVIPSSKGGNAPECVTRPGISGISAAQFFLGGIALAVVMLAFFRLGVDLASAAFAYLIAIVLFSLRTATSCISAACRHVCCRLGGPFCCGNLPFDRGSPWGTTVGLWQ
jgi:hypothetical protein